MTGQADTYYNQGQPQMQVPPQAYNQGGNYQGPPPNYAPNSANGTQFIGGDGKQTYEQTFKLEKPKYNDLWAGILVSLFGSQYAQSKS